MVWMGKVSGYMQKRNSKLQNARNRASKITQDLTMQLLIDCFCLALHDRGWGEARLWELLHDVKDLWFYYGPVIFDIPQTRKEILDSKVEEYREDLDRRLHDFLHDHYADFYTRYGPWIRAPDYDAVNPKKR